MSHITPAIHQSLGQPVRNGLANHRLASPDLCEPSHQLDASSQSRVRGMPTANQILNRHKPWTSIGKCVVDDTIPVRDARPETVLQNIPAAGEARHPTRGKFERKNILADIQRTK